MMFGAKEEKKEGKRIVSFGVRIASFSKVAGEGLMEKGTFEPGCEGNQRGDRRCATWM